MKLLLILLLLLSTILYVESKPRCFTNCTITGIMGRPLEVPDGRCAITSGDNCQVEVNAQYADRTYKVTFGTSFVSGYSRFIYILTSNYLSYSATYSCSKSDSCALDFAKNKVFDLSNRTYHAALVESELKELLEETRPTGSNLICYDGEVCIGGLCQLEYDTKSNSQKNRRCVRQQWQPPVRAYVYDSGNYASLDIECNRTKCNSVDTLNAVKRILVTHNLTDANGRINHGQSLTFSIVLLSGLMLCSTFIHLIVLARY